MPGKEKGTKERSRAFRILWRACNSIGFPCKYDWSEVRQWRVWQHYNGRVTGTAPLSTQTSLQPRHRKHKRGIHYYRISPIISSPVFIVLCYPAHHASTPHDQTTESKGQVLEQPRTCHSSTDAISILLPQPTNRATSRCLRVRLQHSPKTHSSPP